MNDHQIQFPLEFWEKRICPWYIPWKNWEICGRVPVCHFLKSSPTFYLLSCILKLPCHIDPDGKQSSTSIIETKNSLLPYKQKILSNCFSSSCGTRSVRYSGVVMFNLEFLRQSWSPNREALSLRAAGGVSWEWGPVQSTWARIGATCLLRVVCAANLTVAVAAELSFVSAYAEPDFPASPINMRYNYL